MSERPRQHDGNVHGVILALRRASDRRLLLIRRAPGVASGGKVAFPGGAVEVGESLDAAAVREAEEELGWRVSVRGPVWRRAFDDKPLVLWGFLAEWTSGALRPAADEVAETMWLARDELSALERRGEALMGTGAFAEAAERAWAEEPNAVAAAGEPPDTPQLAASGSSAYDEACRDE